MVASIRSVARLSARSRFSKGDTLRDITAPPEPGSWRRHRPSSNGTPENDIKLSASKPGIHPGRRARLGWGSGSSPSENRSPPKRSGRHIPWVWGRCPGNAQNAISPEIWSDVDDLLATGGVGAAAARLVERSGYDPEARIPDQLSFLNGRDALRPRPVFTLSNYRDETV